MPGLDLTQISSNWKKLQGQLQAKKTSENSDHGVKRKRPVNGVEQSRPQKKAKFNSAIRQIPKKPRRMGMAASKPEPAQSDQALHNSHEDNMSTSNKTSGALSHTQTDQVNGGLHSTNRAGKYIALDCEMVGTGPPPYADNVLARVSIVNFNGEQIYDSYVLPVPGIVVKDYRTFVSGIQEQHLVPGYARPFAQVHRDVDTLLTGRILVGHALRNDFEVLQLFHPMQDVRDTSRYAKWRKLHHGTPALRLLAREVLGLEIQGGEHSSLEDARAAMLLFRREKTGFEEEVRRRYGQARKVANAAGAAAATAVVDDGNSESEDLAVLDGEESDILSEADVAAEPEAGQKTTPRAKKKSKKKKRTKRK